MAQEDDDVASDRSRRYMNRRVVVTALVGVVVLTAGALAGTVVLRTGDAATTLVGRACKSFHTAFAARGGEMRAALTRASVDAANAARKRTAFRAFADAAARSNSSTPAPADVRAIDAECHNDALAPDTAVASRAPYLTDATEHSATVNFATDTAVTAAVWFGPAGSDCHTDQATATRQPQMINIGARVDYLFAVTIRGLAAGTQYCYSLAPPVLDVSTQSEPAQFVTAYSGSDLRPFSFAVIGDWGGGGADEARVLRGIASTNASFIVTTGDNAYIDGTQTDYGDLDGGNVFGPSYWPAVGRSRPTFVTSGNHGFSNFRAALQNWPESEVVGASQGRQGRDRYCCIATLPQPHTYASTWYAFDWGPARFYVLDAAFADSTGSYRGDFLAHWNGAVAGCEPCGAEQKWLEADLTAHRSTRLKFAFFHFPLHSDASDHLSDTQLDGSTALEGLLARNGVDIVFNGHAHLYERNVPMIAGSPMLSYVSGGGGVNDPNDKLAAVQHCSRFDAYAIGLGPSTCHAPKPLADGDAYHFLYVTVDQHRVTVTPTNENGTTFDVHTWNF